MHRRVEAAKHITPGQFGIEVAPFHDGLVPKRLGYQCLILDVFDTEELRARAARDPYVDPRHLQDIEPVDLVGSAGSIAALVAQRGFTGQMDYVVSSHNLEHLPDPVTFLQGCGEVLKPGGVVSLVLPDRRVSFDHFRPHSTTSDLIAAFVERRQRPTPQQVFMHASLHCHFVEHGTSSPAFQLTRDRKSIEPFQTLELGWQEWSRQLTAPDAVYRDTHCWAFSPAAFELVLRDLDWLQLIDLDVLEVTELRGHQFFVHLRKPIGTSASPSREAFYARRADLLRATCDEAGSGSFPRATPDLDAARRRITELEARVAWLEGTRSWKVTEPLRHATGLLRSIKGRLNRKGE